MTRGRRGNRGGNYRGSNRGSRGFRGGGRGGMSRGGGGRGAFTDGDLGGGSLNPGRPQQAGSETISGEIQDGLQLCVVFQKVPTSEEMKLLKVHSMRTRSPAQILLFKDLESLESAKLKLDEDPNVRSAKYMGMKAPEKQANSRAENSQIYMKFDVPPDINTLKNLDGRIESESVKFLKDPTTLFVQYPSFEVAESAAELLTRKIGTDGLRLVRESLEMKLYATALSEIQSERVVLRDVPKVTTLKDITPLFPDGNNFDLFDLTFPASDYCHAALRFNDTQRVSEILAKKEYTILGKKVFAVPAHSSLLQNHPNLGINSSDETKSLPQVVKERNSGPPSKKIKLEAEDPDKGQEDVDSDEDDVDSDDVDEDDEESENEGTEEEEDDDDGAEEEE